MFNPTYLVKSRLGVFHLRWPIPKQLHPQQRASYIKLSLQTRDPRKALHFPSFSYDVKNGWGRQQGRWFNNTLLVNLGLKTKTRVFHSLRHTVNTRLVRAGVPDAMVKAIMGHEQDGMTYKQYFKEGFAIEQLDAAIQKLDYGLPE